MVKNNYLYYADDDYLFFMDNYNEGHVYNGMASLAQNICEKYFKHLIDTYFEPKTEEEFAAQKGNLRTHNLKSLLKFIKGYMHIEIEPDLAAKIYAIDGFYFSMRYPGDDSDYATKDDIEDCARAVTACREFTYKMIDAFNADRNEV